MHSIKNKKILIFGGTGFLGQRLIKFLLDANAQIILFARNINKRKDLKKYNSNSNVEIMSWNLHNTKSIEDSFSNATSIINLCGILYESQNGDFDKIHSDLPALLGEISSKNNINSLIHVSALGMSEFSESKYSRSKAIGERKLLKNFPNGKILRPSLLFGKGDNFFGQFSQMSSFSPVLPLISRYTRFQPVFVDDVALAIINLIKGRGKSNTFFELGGEFVYTFEELLKILLEIKKIRRLFIPLNPKLMMLPAFFLQCFPKPPFTVDQMKLLKKDNILENSLPGLKELGVDPTNMKKELIKIYENN